MNRKTLSIVLFAGFAGIAFGAAGCDGTPLTPLTDGQILAVYDEVNYFDIETATLGTKQGSDAAVRDLAQMVLSDHTAVFEAATKLALDLHADLTLPAGRETAEREHADAVTRLKGLSGSAFDQAYLQYEIGFHTEAIRAVREDLMPIAGPEVRAFMESILPGFQAHLDKTKQVAADLGY